MKAQIIVLNFILFIAFAVSAQDYKHPYLNGSGKIVDSTGISIGWIAKDGVIFNAKGEKVGAIEQQKLVDYKGHRLGAIADDGTFTDHEGKMVFYIDPASKGERCKVFDPNGKVVATVHESYKTQACAIHCLSVKMPKH
jgi:hypothetical protein